MLLFYLLKVKEPIKIKYKIQKIEIFDVKNCYSIDIQVEKLKQHKKTYSKGIFYLEYYIIIFITFSIYNVFYLINSRYSISSRSHRSVIFSYFVWN